VARIRGGSSQRKRREGRCEIRLGEVEAWVGLSRKMHMAGHLKKNKVRGNYHKKRKRENREEKKGGNQGVFKGT